MILLSQWYRPDCEKRRGELSRAREANESGDLFDRCIYVDGESRRWTFGEMLTLAAESFPGEVVALANTDIEFDETIQMAADSCKPNRVIALTRWESPSSPRMLGHVAGDRLFSGTQDVWMFVAGQIANPPKLAETAMGAVGCDQVAVAEWALAGCEVFNPAIDVRTWHIHQDSPPTGRAQVFGAYGYPELTTLIGSGVVAMHDWPSPDGRIDLKVIQTWRP